MKQSIWVVGGLLTASLVAQATTVNVSLGQSAENFIETGTGASAGGFGNYVITNGNCTASVGTSTCTLSGVYTGSTPGFTGGTYQLITIFATATPLLGRSTTPGGNSFSYSFIPSGATINLILNQTGGPTYNEPIFAGGAFVGGFSVAYVSTTCSGTPVSPCTTGNVGLTPGAIISGPVIGTGRFDVADTPEPGSMGLAGLALVAGRVLTRRKRS